MKEAGIVRNKICTSYHYLLNMKYKIRFTKIKKFIETESNLR
jgi:hypothetical protein